MADDPIYWRNPALFTPAACAHLSSCWPSPAEISAMQVETFQDGVTMPTGVLRWVARPNPPLSIPAEAWEETAEAAEQALRDLLLEGPPEPMA